MYTIAETGVIRLSDTAFIPFNNGTPEWFAYVAWLNDGNTPEPMPAPNPNDAIISQIAQIEEITGVPRVVREMMLTYAEDLAQRTAEQMTAAGTPTTAEELLTQNIGYVKTKAVDDQIRALRSQLK